MIIYLLLLAGAVILGIPMCRNKAGKIIYCVLMGIALFLVAAFRRSTGHDYNNYGVMYLDYISSPLEDIAVTRIEKGYAMINKILAEYIVDYQIIFVICALLFAVAVTLCVYKYCDIPWIGFACFLTFGVYFNSLNFLRQMIAGFIVMYALRYIEKNQFWRYLMIVIFASCFHLSALIMIPFYFILKIKMTPITLGVYAVLTTLFMVSSWNIIDFITDFVYKGYVVTNIHVTTGVDPTYMIFFAVFFAVAFIIRTRLAAADKFNNVLLNCLFFTLFFELLGVKHSILSRFGVFFIIPTAIVLMPRVILALLAICRDKANGDGKKRTLLSAAAVAAFAAVNITMYGLMLANNYNGVMPYRTVYDDFGTEAAETQ